MNTVPFVTRFSMHWRKWNSVVLRCTNHASNALTVSHLWGESPLDYHVTLTLMSPTETDLTTTHWQLESSTVWLTSSSCLWRKAIMMKASVGNSTRKNGIHVHHLVIRRLMSQMVLIPKRIPQLILILSGHLNVWQPGNKTTFWGRKPFPLFYSLVFET